MNFVLILFEKRAISIYLACLIQRVLSIASQFNHKRGRLHEKTKKRSFR
jgi:hypothetical protein